MRVKLQCLGILKKYSNNDNGIKTIELNEPRPVKELIESMGIPSAVVMGVIVNSKLKSLSYLPQDRDEIMLLPFVGGG